MIKIENNQVYSLEGNFIRRKGSEVYFKRGVVLPSDSIEDYKEIMEMPFYSKEEYDAKVAELIHERYDDDKEKAMINNMLEDNPTEEHVAEYRAYQAFRAECKVRAKSQLRACALSTV